MTTICITGMHRSGTSLLARVVNLLGVHLGSPDDHLAANRANPTGYWEHRGVVRIANDLFAHLGGDWAGPPHLPLGWEHDPSLAPLRERAAGVLGELRSDAEVVGFKDPRACLLLPFWREVTEVDRVIACVRPPRAVTASLARRNELPERHVAALTSRYLSSLVANAPELYLVDYAQLLSASPELLGDLAAHLGLPSPTDDVVAEVAAFVQPDLDHHDGSAEGTPELALAEEVHARLGELDANRQWLVALAGTLNEAAASDGRAPGGVGARPTRLQTVTRERDDARDQLAAMEADRDHIATHRDALRRELTAARKQRDAARRREQRLRERRSVRIALGIAALIRPVLAAWRRVRGREGAQG